MSAEEIDLLLRALQGDSPFFHGKTQSTAEELVAEADAESGSAMLQQALDDCQISGNFRGMVIVRVAGAGSHQGDVRVVPVDLVTAPGEE